MTTPYISRKVADDNRAMYDQFVARFATIVADAIGVGHCEVGLTVKVKDGKIVGAEEINRRMHFAPRDTPMRRAA